MRWYSSALLTLSTRDAYPLLADGLFLASTVAALRPPSDVLREWRVADGDARASRMGQTARAAGAALALDTAATIAAHDERWKQETTTSASRRNRHTRGTCLRVQVVARSQQAAERECRAIVQTLTSCQKRYASGSGAGMDRPATTTWTGTPWPDLASRPTLGHRMPPWPRVWPLFPLA